MPLPGETPTTFPDLILQEVTKGDDLLASFKFTRFNNYKHNLYNTLCEYDSPSALQTRIEQNKIVSALFNQ
jgi:hypothetical protein